MSQMVCDCDQSRLPRAVDWLQIPAAVLDLGVGAPKKCTRWGAWWLSGQSDEELATDC
jgi:hypothetical protein